MSEIREQVAELLSKEMDRKHFLQFSLAAILASFGVSRFISTLLSNSKATTKSKSGSAYGVSRFGK